MGLHEIELSILLVDNDEITRLNRYYLSRDHPTDVLAFAMREGEDTDLHPTLLGDVVISTEMAAIEAQQRGVTNQQEVTLLLIHGVLHLIGYEHEGASEGAAEMQAMEKEILAHLGLSRNHIEQS